MIDFLDVFVGALEKRDIDDHPVCRHFVGDGLAEWVWSWRLKVSTCRRMRSGFRIAGAGVSAKTAGANDAATTHAE